MSTDRTDPKITYVTWRHGRPRFIPSKGLRERGYEGEDLKNDDGAWMTAGQCLEWSRAFTRQLAREDAAKPKKKAKAKKATPAAVPLTRSYSVEQLFADWLEPGINPHMGTLAKKTVDEYRYKGNVFKNYAPDIWTSEVEALDKPICLGVYDKLFVLAGHASAHGAMTILGIAIEWAISRGRVRGLVVNPAHGLGMAAPPARLRVGSIEEIDHFVATADAAGWPEIGDMIMLGVWTGQRQGDRLELRYEGVRARRMHFRQMKTGARVSIPVARELQKRLDAAIIRRKDLGIDDEHVVVCERLKRPFTSSHYRHKIEDMRVLAAATMPSIADLRDQDLRDTAVTWLKRAGCEIHEICAITGHSPRTIFDILKHYMAIEEEDATAAIEKMEKWHAKERRKRKTA
ncbi:tyrosine-type recombinase/integrase [Rhizobium ruizarguesonis]